MKNKIFQNISKIIKRDTKSTTYKFALLRGVIDIIQDNSPYITFSNNRVYFPLGLLVEKWLLYYYPILESLIKIPQINGKTRLAFEKQFYKIISAYKNEKGFSVFYNDIKNKGIPKIFEKDFLELVNKLSETITMMPMKYIGRSISEDYYSIFNFKLDKRQYSKGKIDIEYLINNLGSFSIPIEYYQAFKILGSFISGQDSILIKWAEFSVSASGNNLTIQKVLYEILKNPITERDILNSKRMYKSILKKEGKVFCVWTGKLITRYDIDHLIPFSAWRNNDLWNLLPSQPKINNLKRDKIPSAEVIENRKDLILYYWQLLNRGYKQRFQKEIKVALLGNYPISSWEETAIQQLQRTCRYLIKNRGYEEWII